MNNYLLDSYQQVLGLNESLYDYFIVEEDVLIPCQLRQEMIQTLHDAGFTWELIFNLMYTQGSEVIE